MLGIPAGCSPPQRRATQRLACSRSDMPCIPRQLLSLLSGTQVIIKYLENPITVNEMMASSVSLTFPSPLLVFPFLGSTF